LTEQEKFKKTCTDALEKVEKDFIDMQNQVVKLTEIVDTYKVLYIDKAADLTVFINAVEKHIDSLNWRTAYRTKIELTKLITEERNRTQ